MDKMDKRELEFIVAYADVYDMMDRPFDEVCDELCELFSDMPYAPHEYMESFMERYNSMKENGLDYEVKYFTNVLGNSFFEACDEWDV